MDGDCQASGLWQIFVGVFRLTWSLKLTRVRPIGYRDENHHPTLIVSDSQRGKQNMSRLRRQSARVLGHEIVRELLGRDKMHLFPLSDSPHRTICLVGNPGYLSAQSVFLQRRGHR